MKNRLLIGIAIFLIVCLCCTCVLIVGGLGYYVYKVAEEASTANPIPTSPTEVVAQSTPPSSNLKPEHSQSEPGTATPMPSLQVTQIPTDTLTTLRQEEVPINDLREIVQRFKGLKDIPLTLEPPAAWHVVGEQMNFWAVNADSNENFQIKATLRFITEHAYFWVENGVSYNAQELKDLAATFETQIYPTNRTFFGSEWTPGIDGDPHIYILYAQGLGSSLAGYYSTADSVHPLVHPYSNGHEMFFFNADNSPMGDSDTFGTLAHEFQHMIHWYQDRNEDSWLNEGFSELALWLNSYYNAGFDWLFSKQPDWQLNTWSEVTDEARVHYGSSFLFVVYFLDRFGETATQELVRNPKNGLDSVDEVLGSLGIYDPMREHTYQADDVFLDWAITNYLQDSQVSDGRFNYNLYDTPPKFKETERLNKCPVEPQERTVKQYGTDYIRITCKGSYTLSWSGSLQTEILSKGAHSGNYALWSNQGDESEMSLMRTFDFRGAGDRLTLDYWAWFDIEEDYDYLYLSASVDGENWQIIQTPSGTASNPAGNNFGWGYNGRSGGGKTAEWIRESVDLSDYAGQVVQLRFDYITDGAVNGEGFLLDDISIPEINYQSDFEADDGGWERQGWVRVDNILPQTFRLALIKVGDETTVEYILLNADNSVEIPLEIGKQVKEVIFVVTATTRFTQQPAAYQFEIQ